MTNEEQFVLPWIFLTHRGDGGAVMWPKELRGMLVFHWFGWCALFGTNINDALVVRTNIFASY